MKVEMERLELEHVAAFSAGSEGGNPAGVWVGAALPSATHMQQVAREIGYSETAFAASIGDAWQVRYFSPEAEIPFCGHATIALGAVLARRVGDRRFRLALAHDAIEVDAWMDGALGRAKLTSPTAGSARVDTGDIKEALALFGLGVQDLEPALPPALISAGARHLLLPLARRDCLSQMKYDFEAGRRLMSQAGWVTVVLCHMESAMRFHVRNAFAYGGVYEDPATGAATAALAGYLRRLGWPAGEAVTICQGDDMGIPCRLEAVIPRDANGRVQVSGTARFIEAPREP